MLQTPDDARSFDITGFELRVLKLLAQGLQSKEIAESIGRRKPTVEGYIRILCIKLNAKSRTHLVARAFQVGLLDRSDCA